MPRPRKSSAELKLHGQFRPDRHGAEEPAAVGSLSKPEGLDEDASWFWDQHAQQVKANGAGGGDMSVFISACFWWSLFCVARKAVVEGDADYRTFIKMSMAWKNFERAASRLGLSPTERAKLRPQGGGKGKLSKYVKTG
jgi:hypothetical protein